MTIKQTLEKIESEFQVAKIIEAGLEAQILTAFILQKTREFVLTYPELSLNDKQLKKLYQLKKLRLQGWPLAYLIKTKPFFKLDFKVNRQVLIPRPETELLVEKILNHIQKQKYEKLTILDLGTGSGCLIISLANEFKSLNLCEPFDLYGLDISGRALRLAQNNATTHQVADQIKFIKSDLLTLFIKKRSLINKLSTTNNLIIVANLPYLPNNWQQDLTDRQILELQHEPSLALFGGTDGFDYYRRLKQQLIKMKSQHPQLNIQLYCEIDPSQFELFKQEFSFLGPIKVSQDFNQHWRIAQAN